MDTLNSKHIWDTINNDISTIKDTIYNKYGITSESPNIRWKLIYNMLFPKPKSLRKHPLKLNEDEIIFLVNAPNELVEEIAIKLDSVSLIDYYIRNMKNLSKIRINAISVVAVFNHANDIVKYFYNGGYFTKEQQETILVAAIRSENTNIDIVQFLFNDSRFQLRPVISDKLINYANEIKNEINKVDIMLTLLNDERIIRGSQYT